MYKCVSAETTGWSDLQAAPRAFPPAVRTSRIFSSAACHVNIFVLTAHALSVLEGKSAETVT